jgi:molybdate transport system substrate-binding protein
VRLRAALGAALAACVIGCGGGEDPRLTVSAATSLKGAFEDYGASFEAATARFSFAGSDALATQIRQGVKPDVYAAANTRLPEQLFAEGLVDEPVRFAGNRLVIAAPADGGVSSIDDLAADGRDLAVGAPSVPIGSYTREVLGRLSADRRRAILANVRSQEPDASGIVGKLVQGAADAGFVYATDVTAAGASLRTIELPAALRPEVAYGVAVVKGAKQPEAARAFIDGLLRGEGRMALERAGFEPAPG